MNNSIETFDSILSQINASDAALLDVERNPFCRHYDRCLDEAALLNLPELPCAQCEYRHAMHWDREQLMVESDACWNLLTAIFTGKGSLLANSSKRRKKKSRAK